ncbi:MAG: hypothetical protein ACKO2G_01175 [Verrucomicrobiales bacterium]
MTSAKQTRPAVSLIAAAILGVAISQNAFAELRTWTSADGRTIEAELVSFDGKTVNLKGPSGQRYAFDKSKLSQGDLDFLQDYAPATGSSLTAPKPGKVASPAKEAKIDPKTFVKGDKPFEIPQQKFEVLETPHFKILHSEKAKPAEIAELAERLWIDTAFFHPTFAQKFTERKQAIFLVDEETTYLAIGDWFAGLLNDIGQGESAEMVKKTWPLSAAGSVSLPASIADGNGVLQSARVFRTYEKSSEEDDGKGERIKGVWVPFRVHCIAGDLLDEQIANVSRFGSGGLHGLTTGYAYYKEVFLTGKSETSLLSAESAEDAKSTGGFQGSDSWPEELKKAIRKKEVTPTLEVILNLTPQNATPGTNVLAYSFIHFLHSSPERVAGWPKLIERISTSSQVPEVEDMAKLLGFESAEAMQKQWVEYISSGSFR